MFGHISSLLPLDRYPSFAAFFQRREPESAGPDYLPLLHLYRPPQLHPDQRLDDAVEAVRTGCQISPDLNSELLALLSELSWRPNLVAACAFALGYGGTSLIDSFWQTFDRGTMVTPQIAVALSLRDPAFESEAQRRITDWCTSDETWRDPMALSALIGLCRLRPSCQSWLASVTTHPEIEKALAHDRLEHRGDRIATGWLERLAEFTLQP